MSVNSNISSYYEEQVAFAADTAKTCIESDGDDEQTALQYAIDNAFYIYYSDQAYLLAHAFNAGVFEWGGEVDWSAIYEMVYNDVAAELEALREEE